MPVVYGYTKSFSTSKKWQYLYHSTGDSPLMNGHYLSGGCQHFSHPGKLYLTAYAVVNVASQMWSNTVRKLQNNFDLCPTCIYCYSYWHFVFTILAECWTIAQNVVAQTLNQTCPFVHLSRVSSYLNVFWWFSGKGAVWTHLHGVFSCCHFVK